MTGHERARAGIPKAALLPVLARGGGACFQAA